MKTIQLADSDVLPDAEVDARMGTFVDEQAYRVLVGAESTTVLKPDGTPLLIYVRDCIPRSLCHAAFEVFKKVDVDSGGTNRGMAAGMIEEHVEAGSDLVPSGARVGRGLRVSPIKADGTVSNTTRAAAVPTAIIGYFDRYPRIPYCRQTSFTRDNPELWQQALPYIQRVSQLFEQYAPAHFGAQRDFVRHCHPDFVIPGTVFSTLTINRNWRTALHKDAGDFRSGLGCMSVLQGGEYRGGELIFPKYGVAVDMRTGCMAFADVHAAHGNAPLVGVPGRFVRMSAVFYCRTGIAECGSAEFELHRAKQVGDRISTEHATVQSSLFDRS